jgi:purine-binding chemotaxis protein CheW
LYLQIRLKTERYALSLEHLIEVVTLGEVTPVPGAPVTVLGLCSLRGEILPVLDLGRLLVIRGAATPRRLVIVADGDRRAALAVEDVTDFGQLPETTEAVDSPLLRGGVIVEGALISVIDVPAVLGSTDGSTVSEPA